jgi:ribosomal protein L11 methyltransferase
LIRLAIRVSRERAELVLAELLELVPDGVEEVELDEHTVEYAAYGAPGELPALPDLQALAGGSLVALSTSEVADDWSERWRRFHRPVLIAPPPASELPALRVRPPWEPAAGDGQAALQEIVIDPGQAFGTGAHATTRLCLELLLELSAGEPARGALLDVGTGSGVLAIAAVHLGYAPVLALDNDPESVAAARLNADANGVAIELRRLDLRAQELPGGARVVCANLLRPLLVALAATMQWTPAALIAGGLLHADVEEVAGAFAQHLGLGVRERRNSGEWSALLLAR